MRNLIYCKYKTIGFTAVSLAIADERTVFNIPPIYVLPTDQVLVKFNKRKSEVTVTLRRSEKK